jgi:uncharacterized protein YndB with AHSA1/START domain
VSTIKITAEPGTPFIDTERAFDAPRELLYRAFTDPALVGQWLGPRKYRMEIDAFEARDGGRWRYTHSDDTATHGFHGVFHGEPSLDEGITQTFEYEGYPGHVALEHVDFIEQDGRTLVRGRSVYQSVEDRDGMVQSGMSDGMEDAYSRLDELLERERSTAAR